MSLILPARRAFALLRVLAEGYGFRLDVPRLWGVELMCRVCFPDQPEQVQHNGRFVPWRDAVIKPYDGLVTIRYPRAPGDDVLLPAEDAVSLLYVESCRRHDEEYALGGWRWRDDLAEAIEAASITEAPAWEARYDALTSAREAHVAAETAMRINWAAGLALTPAERVQVVAGLLVDAGLPVSVEQARIAWACGCTADAGDWQRMVIIIDSEGVPQIGPEWCTTHGDAMPELADVAAAYRRVAELSPEDRAAFKPVPESRRRSRGGSSWKGGGDAGKPPPARGEAWPTDRTRDWCHDQGLNIDLGLHTLFKRVCEVEPDESKRPPRAALARMKKASRAE